MNTVVFSISAMHILERAIQIGGPTQEAFAEKLGKRQSYVSMLKHRVIEKNRPIPTDICPKIEEATGGEISRHDLRPDIFGPAPKKRRAA